MDTVFWLCLYQVLKEQSTSMYIGVQVQVQVARTTSVLIYVACIKLGHNKNA